MNDSALVIHLMEYSPRFLDAHEFTHEDAQIILARYGDRVEIEWPTPKTGNQWKLLSLGWVGFIPLKNTGLSLTSKVPLGNLFRMLEYAYDLKSFQFLEGLYDCATIREYYERLALLLSKLLLNRARLGLYKAYQEMHEDLSFVRGRMDIPTLSRTSVKSRVPCFFEEQTYDIEENGIIAWTLHVILASGACSERTLPTLRKAERLLRNSVSLRPYSASDCLGRSYNRLNADYETIHKLCFFFLSCTGPTQISGGKSMVPFLVNMGRLFELFVSQWLTQNLPAYFRLGVKDTKRVGYLGMEMDLTLYERTSGRPLCVLDTKYKAHSHVLRDDYNQVVAYADALGCGSAMLVYPVHINKNLDEMPGNIRVQSSVFDLAIDLEKAGQLFLGSLSSIFVKN